MIRVIVSLWLAGMLTGVWGQVNSLTGAGATFPYPIYSRWAYQYYRETGIRINYQSIGSGGGVKQIKSRTVDFGASDAPLKPEKLKEYGLTQWPMVLGGVVPVVNIQGIAPGKLRLTPEVLSDIFLGKITRWDDPIIRQLNPGVELPDQKITVIHRADGSGTTWIFTHYLAQVSSEWASKVGYGKAVAWPAGLGGKGNEGVAAFVRKIPGALGYVEYAYAVQSHMSYVQLKNLAGKFVNPSSTTFQVAAAHARWDRARDFYLVLTNQPGEQAWPITGATFILMPRTVAKPAKAKAVLEFFHWCFMNGGQAALELDYVPLPRKVIQLVEQSWRKTLRSTSGEPIWK